MTLTIRSTEIADRIGDVLDILADDTASLDEWAAAYSVAQQVKLRLDRSLKARRDDIIVGMERGGLKSVGPLTVKSTAVDPRYVVNDPDNHEDLGVQDALAELRADSRTRPYVRAVPQHLEIDPLALAADVQLGVQAALTLYRELNKRRWRVEQARRLSLAVREAKAPKADAA